MPGLTTAPTGGRLIHELWHRITVPLSCLARLTCRCINITDMMLFESHGEYAEYRENTAFIYMQRQNLLQEMATASRPILTRGYCVCCRKMAEFKTDPVAQGLTAGATPNWREGLICQGCGLNSRMRAAVHLMEVVIGPNRGTRLYLTEQVTALYRWVKTRYPLAVGSEFLRDGTKSGEWNLQGIRHEDLTALRFPDDRFDVVFTLEVMEHIPDFHQAFSECARILAPGGKMLLCVPFHRGAHHLLRARVKEDGTIHHLHPPEYHGDPLDREGCLCFHHFGWDILDFLRRDGFQRAAAYSIWSEELGYLAGEGDMVMFIAEK